MFFVPLNQIESVELVIHALRAAAGQADCSVCPAKKVCMQQCLSIADAVEKMMTDETLPGLDLDPDDLSPEPSEKDPSAEGGNGFLTVVK